MSKHPKKPIEIVEADFAAGRLSRREFVRYAALVGVAAPAAYAAAGLVDPGHGLVAKARAEDLPQGGTLRIGNRIKDIKTPHAYSWGGYDSNMSRQVLEYLTFTDVDGVTKPYLAESWTVSDDLKTWTFKLRPGVKWHNGEPLTAADVVWNLEQVLDPAVGSSMIGLMKGYLLNEVTGADGKPTTEVWSPNAIEKVDDLTFRINCKVPQVAVPEHLFHYPMAIMYPGEQGVFGVGAQGTGAFTLTEFDLGKKAVFQKVKGYWGGDAAIDTLEMIDVGDDPTAAISALASKQLHGLVFADPVQYQALNAIEGLELYSVPTAETAVMRMRPDAKPFDDPKVRKALRLASDPTATVGIALQGLGVEGEHHHCSPAHPDYEKIAGFPRDVDGAKKLLAEAGYPDGVDVEIFCPTDNPWIQTMVEASAEQWGEAGIRTKITLMPGAQYWDVWTKVPFGATIWYHRPLAIMCLGLAYRTGVPWNESGWSNKEFDEILGEAEGTLDLTARKELVGRLEKIMREDGPIVQPVFRSTFTFMDKNVKGFSMHPTNYLFAWKVGIAS
jgi:peptide/nickel transport system substrate-binding protein